jgi:hypothetical protein
VQAKWHAQLTKLAFIALLPAQRARFWLLSFCSPDDACCITPPANPIFVSLYPSLILGLALGPGIAEKQWEMPLRLHFLAATGVFRQNNKINAQISSDLFLYEF